MRTLHALSAESLSEQLHAVIRTERSCMVESLFLLAELHRRGGHLQLGFDSLFSYCLEELKLSRGSSYRRSVSARLINEFPAVSDFLRDGRLNATTLVMLDGLLTETNHASVLAQASDLTELEMKRLVATLAPQPSKPDSLRKLPVPNAKPSTASPVVPAFGAGLSPAQSADALDSARMAHDDTASKSAPAGMQDRRVESAEIPSRAENVSSNSLTETVFEQRASVAPVRRRTLKVQPINARDSRIQFDVGPEFVERFEEVRAALSHVVPDGNFEDVFLECFRVTLAACEKRRLGSARATSVRSRRDEGLPSSSSVASGPSSKLELSSVSTSATGPSGPAPSSSSSLELGAATPSSSSNLELPGEKPSPYIAVAVRREAHAEAEGRCTYVGPNGRRCNSRWKVEFDHREPRALGGGAEHGNIRVLCRAHNALEARRFFGDLFAESFGSDTGEH